MTSRPVWPTLFVVLISLLNGCDSNDLHPTNTDNEPSHVVASSSEPDKDTEIVDFITTQVNSTAPWLSETTNVEGVAQLSPTDAEDLSSCRTVSIVDGQLTHRVWQNRIDTYGGLERKAWMQDRDYNIPKGKKSTDLTGYADYEQFTVNLSDLAPSSLEADKGPNGKYVTLRTTNNSEKVVCEEVTVSTSSYSSGPAPKQRTLRSFRLYYTRGTPEQLIAALKDLIQLHGGKDDLYPANESQSK